VRLDDRDWYTPPQLAKKIGCNPHTIIGWIRDGQLVAHDLRVHGQTRPRWRIRASDFEIFLAARRSIAPPKQRRRRRTVDDTPVFFDDAGNHIRSVLE